MYAGGRQRSPVQRALGFLLFPSSQSRGKSTASFASVRARIVAAAVIDGAHVLTARAGTDDGGTPAVGCISEVRCVDPNGGRHKRDLALSLDELEIVGSGGSAGGERGLDAVVVAVCTLAAALGHFRYWGESEENRKRHRD
jgi:hypothetical protein